MEPKVSIIIAVYNVESFLKRCVDSVINQSYKNLEIILVNDESPDNCGQICDEYSKQDKRIKVIHQKNKGISGARNSGLKIATGNYIGFVDSDDWIEREMYKSLIDTIKETNSEIAICSFQESTGIDEITNIDTKYISKILNKKDLLHFYIEEGFYVWRNLYSRQIINNLRFDENILFTEDIIFCVDITELVEKAVFIDVEYYNYFIDNNTSLTKSRYNEKTFCTIEANLYLQSKINILFPNDKLLKHIARKRLLNNAIYHYYQIHYNRSYKLDTDYTFRKKLKVLINKNFRWSFKPSVLIICSRFLNVTLFRYFFGIHNNFSNKL